MKKPPIGIIPEIIWKEQRIQDIDAAINRYQEAGLAINTKWIYERNKLIYDIKFRNDNTHGIKFSTQSPRKRETT